MSARPILVSLGPLSIRRPDVSINISDVPKNILSSTTITNGSEYGVAPLTKSVGAILGELVCAEDGLALLV